MAFSRSSMIYSGRFVNAQFLLFAVRLRGYFLMSSKARLANHPLRQWSLWGDTGP